jgi:dihydrofolate reductase
MKCKVYIATSLDGYIADKNNKIDWLMETPNPTNDDFGFSEFMDSIDALIMGKNTFETVNSFDCEWPYSKPVYVLSSSLKEIPEDLENKVFLVNSSTEKLLKLMEEKAYKNLYIDGGRVIQSFLKKDLIDELILTKIPILLGGGVPLFSHLDKELRFNHIKTEVLLGELVKSHYVKSN